MTGFIIGTGRCGTTMLAQMLNSHSAICVPLELQILFEYSNNGSGLYEIFKDKKNEYFGPDDFVDVIESKCPYKFHKYFDYRSFFTKQRYPIRNLRKLVYSLCSKIAESKNKKILIEQTPWYGQRIDILNELFPDAKYIHMIRDGRDVAISFARTPWWSDDIGQNLERWHNEIQHIIDSSNKILGPDQLLQVRYEDFVDQPQNGLVRICKFLGVDFEDTILDAATYIDYGLFSKSDPTLISSVALNEWSKRKEKPTFKGSRYVWANYPDHVFLNLPEHINHSLKALGYEAMQPDGTCVSLSCFSQKDRLNMKTAAENQAAADRNSQIDSLKKAAAERDEQIATLTRTMGDQTTHIAGLESGLADKDRHIKGLESGLADKDRHINGLETSLTDKNRHIKGLESDLTDKDRHIKGLESDLTDKDRHINGLESDLTDKDRHIDGLETSLTDKDRHINGLETSLMDKDRHINGLESNLTDKDRHIDGLETNLVDKDRHINGLESGLTDKDRHIKGLESGLADKDRHIKGLESDLTDKDRHIDGLETSLMDKDRHINGLETSLMDKDRHIKGLESDLMDKDRHIKGLESGLADKDRHIGGLETSLEEYNKYIGKLKRTFLGRIACRFLKK